MGYQSANVSKLQYGKYLAAALAYLASKQHDPVGLIVFDEADPALPAGIGCAREACRACFMRSTPRRPARRPISKAASASSAST